MARTTSHPPSPAARSQASFDTSAYPFQKVLIANRGEIALRVIRACRDVGLSSVAVYSDADRSAEHVRLADEAVHIGPAPASESYLSIARILEAAKKTGAGAIHPGYGFLSENAEFADACAAASIIFIGPPGRVMRAMGEKTAARRVAEAAGVPIVPGFNAGLEDAAEAARLAERVGYPIMLKAAAGGGGKGIRFVHRPEELESALRLARSEARGAFGDDTVYLEKAVIPARHIEVQIIGDTHGSVVHLGERECSVQRRHQKLIEESPSPALDEELRARFTEAAVRLGKAVGYVGAGTCEFLLGPDRNFYFLEVNARLQVEHPVTELRTGLDLVREQLRVAAGLPLSFRQEDVSFTGHAVEARITAEDPFNRFLPASGSIAGLSLPMGPGVRLDTAIYDGMQIPLFYDSLLAKLICWGQDRDEAVARLRRALDEFNIVGVRTTIPFAQWITRHPRFLLGDLSTDFVAEEWNLTSQPPLPQGEGELDPEQVAALAAALLAQQVGQAQARRRHAGGAPDHEDGSRWRTLGRRSALGGRW